MKREAKFQVIFNHFLKDSLKHIFVYKIPDGGFAQSPFDCFSVDKFHEFWAWELKQTKTDSLPFSAVVPHQVMALQIVQGYVVIKYPTTVAIIPIDTFVLESKRSKRRSLTSKRAMEISTINFK